MGPCQYTSGHMKCTCPEVRLGTTVESDLPCLECGHEMKDHSAYASPTASLQTPATNMDALGPFICPRDEAVIKLAESLDEFSVIHVRGTPSSGKTTLSLLLAKYYETHNLPFVYLPAWECEEAGPVYTCLKLYEAKYGSVSMDPYQFLYSLNKTTFIIDEAQTSYDDQSFWSQVIKTRSGQSYGLRFCLFSSYGSPSAGRPQPSQQTPVSFGPPQRVSLLPSSGPYSAQFGLFYTHQEFNDVIERLLSIPNNLTFSLSKDARGYLFSVTNGHPAAVEGLFYFVYHTYRTDIKQGRLNELSKAQVLYALDDDIEVFEFLKSRAISRSFPKKKRLTVEAVKTLRRALVQRGIPFNEDDPGLMLCFQMGWLHADAIDGMGDDIYCVFPTRVHEKYVEVYLSSEYERPFPKADFPTLVHLCTRVLQNFSKSQLQLSSKGRMGTSGRPTNPEAQFKDEFYRALTELLGHGIGISSEWSRRSDGRIDFRILGTKWGVELLRDGDHLAEHRRRFTPTGTYGNWIKEKQLEDWVILDCRHSYPEPTSSPEPKLWRVVFKEHYTSAVVLNSENVVIIPEFPLLS